MPKIPRSSTQDYSAAMSEQRRDFIETQTKASLSNVGHFSISPESLAGNIENFTGVAQVPIGFAGPMLVNGETAEGEFYVPMATTEGTLVASYSRGMRLTREAGGITTTVIDDAMQRAPMFAFADAREALAFGKWVIQHFDTIKQASEETTKVGQLRDIEQHAVSKLRWLRFNFTCGDAAGQNMVSRATKAGCDWILENYPGKVEHFVLAANMDTDKKHSHLNSCLLYTSPSPRDS